MTQPGALWSSRQSLRPFIPTLVVGFLAAGALAYFGMQAKDPSMRMGLLAGAGVLAALLLLRWLGAWIGSLGSEYRVDQQTIFQRTGLLSKRTVTVSLRDVRSINLNQGIWQRMLGVGDVLVGTAGHEGLEIAFKDVDDPQKVVDLMQRLRRDLTTIGQVGA